MREYKIFDKDTHEYTVTIEESERGPTYVMKRSRNSAWTEPGKEILRVMGDETTLEFVFYNKLGKTFSYSDIVELRILLNVISHDQPNLSPEYQAIRVTETTGV